MKLHGDLNDDAFAKLVELATGKLDAREELEMQHHLLDCPSCRDAFGWVRSLAGALNSEVEPRELPNDGQPLWDRIESRIDSTSSVQPWQEWQGDERPSQLVRAEDQGDWLPTAMDGVVVKRLAVDSASSSLTMLIRMTAGASYPAHSHAGAEECFVLEGDLVIGDLTMRAGDFQRMEAGTEHPEQTTREGCLLMLRSSRNDRLVG